MNPSECVTEYAQDEGLGVYPRKPMPIRTTKEELDLTNQWRALPLNQAPLSVTGHRSPQALDQIVDYLDVLSSARYAATTKATYCATFLWDWSRCMGVEVPHWALDGDGTPCRPAHDEGSEWNCNRLATEWLPKFAERYGWRKCLAGMDAQLAAEQGKPAFIIWANPDGGHGHCSVVVPAHGEDGVQVAQAGRVSWRRQHVGYAFSPQKLAAATFWAHE